MPGLVSGALWGAALILFTALPASAAGPLTHMVVAERCFSQLVNTHPWLAPHRDAFYWGALAVDWGTATGSPHARPEPSHAQNELAALWRKAASKGALPRAFVLGWAVHLATDETQTTWLLEAGRTEQLAALIQLPTDRGNVPLAADLALDAALLPGVSNSLQTMALAARAHAATPAGGAIQQLLREVVGVAEPAYLNWAGFIFLAGARGSDAYLALRAKQVHLETLAPLLTGRAGRAWVGDPRSFLTAAAEAGSQQARQLLDDKTQAPSARSAGRMAAAARTVRATLMRP